MKELSTNSLKRLSPTSPFDVFYLTWKIVADRRSLWFSPGYNAPLFGLNRYIFTIHDLNHIDLAANSNLLKRLYYQWVMRRACRKAVKVLTVSEYSRQRIIQWAKMPASQVINVGNGVSTNFTPDGERHTPGYRYLFCVGNRKAHKNEQRLLRAFAAADIALDIRLLFTGPEGGGLADLARELGVEGRVVFLGKVTEVQLPSIYRSAIALVFPTLYEGFGLPVVEAMASGTPVVTSNVTSLPEVAGDAAILVDPLDEVAIADGIKRVVTDQGLRQVLIERGIQQAKRFSWDAVAQRVTQVLDEEITTLRRAP
ncbi:glycosyltransferase family 4 protein [Noviherbaspirillum sedimenti]|uniref:glycosyltransferase family 4 protein n=1 Tax=Noviherbaspirillum sedimenti TaxID=2320865 RepID=UPI0018F662C1|nr:glycosyltransferase family 1 protein [Noviherbaspirillum sedimenti]